MLINQNTSPKTLRKTLRQLRRSLNTYQQQLAAKHLVYRLAKTTFKNAKKIGFYQYVTWHPQAAHAMNQSLVEHKLKLEIYFPV